MNEARHLHDDGVVFADVRNPRLYTRRHIPGAIRLDLKDRFTEESLSAVVARDQPFVIYCGGVKCSRSYRDAGLPMDKVEMSDKSSS